MNESSYIRAIHRRLTVDVFRWKINARFAPGVPDAWYSGKTGDIWIEYKYLRTKTAPEKIRVKLTALQRKWAIDRLGENRRVAVIVGTPFGSYILATQQEIEKNTVMASGRPRYSLADVAAWIETQTIGKTL